MGIARSISGTHSVVSVVLLLVCVGVSSWGFMTAMVPKVEKFAYDAADQYDVFLPEIAVKNGKASIKQEQPYFVDLFAGEDVVFAIDTREEGYKQAMSYLKNAKAGAVLTRDAVVTKNQRQIRIISLAGLPDLNLNSAEIRFLLDRYFPTVVRWVWISVILYFLFAKPIQVLVLALIPLFGARSYSVDVTYGDALKIATFSMIPPVLTDLLMDAFGLWIWGSFVIYFAVYIAVLIFSVWDLVKTPRGPVSMSEVIHPQ